MPINPDLYPPSDVVRARAAALTAAVQLAISAPIIGEDAELTFGQYVGGLAERLAEWVLTGYTPDFAPATKES